MCAVSLEGVPDTSAREAQIAHAGSAAAASPSHIQQEEEKMSVEQEGIVCPECNTPNESTWSFCQQCGKRLPKSSAPPSSGELKSARGLTTVPDQQAVSGPGSGHNLKTVAENSSPAERSLKTVAEKSFQGDEAVTVKEKSPAAEVRKPVDAPAPPAIVEPSAEPALVPSKSDPWADLPTVVTEAPPPTAETPSPIIAGESQSEQPSYPSQPSGPAQDVTQHVQSVSGVLCAQCGQTSNAGSSSCANCGAPIGFGRTMVISSESTPASSIRGRLHLVMEGGQPGDVYEIGDETLIGRSNGKITFPHDGFMSGRHARIVKRGAAFVLTDEGSRNGTFVKIKGEIELEPGDMILVGKQLFRFEV
jgi:hypothetical protein